MTSPVKAPIKAILFDLDDTLWPIIPVIERAESIMFDWLAAHAPGVARRFTIGSLRERRRALLESHPHLHLDLRLLRHTGLTEAFLACNEDVTKVELAVAVFSEARNAVTPFADVVPTLSRLRERFALASVTNGVADLNTIGLAHYFQASVAAYRLGIAKPQPEIFHAACDALGVRPEQAVYIGDDPVLDVEGAQKAGLRAVWMNRPELDLRSLPPHIVPDGICTTLYEFDRWLSNHIVSAGSA